MKTITLNAQNHNDSKMGPVNLGHDPYVAKITGKPAVDVCSLRVVKREYLGERVTLCGDDAPGLYERQTVAADGVPIRHYYVVVERPSHGLICVCIPTIEASKIAKSLGEGKTIDESVVVTSRIVEYNITSNTPILSWTIVAKV